MKSKRLLVITAVLVVLIACFTVISSAETLEKVENIEQNYADCTTVGIVFDRVGSSEEYQVYISETEDGVYSWTSTSSDIECYIDELEAGSHYFIKLRAVEYDSLGSPVFGSFSDPVEVVTSPACSITNIKQSDMTLNSTRLTWNNDYYVDGYKVTYGGHEMYTQSQSVIIPIEGISEYVSIQGYCKSGDYYAFDENSRDEVNHLDVFAKPATPTGIEQTECGATSVTVSCSFDYYVDRFQIYSSDEIDGEYEFLKNDTECDFDAIKNLEPGKHYYLKIRKGFHNTYTDQWIYSDFSEPFDAVTSLNAKVRNIKQTTTKTDSVTITWDEVAGADCYIVEYGTVKKTVTNPTCVIPIVKKNDDRTVYVLPVIKSATYKAEGNTTTKTVYPRPTKFTNLKCTGYYQSSADAYFAWNAPYYSDGYQYKLYSSTGKCLKTGSKKDDYGELGLYDLSTSKFYSLKVRPYKIIQGTKVYGDWSKKIYFSGGPDVKGTRKTYSIDLSWKKVSGATNYTVYISKSSQGGFKKVTTTKNLKCTIKKYAGKKLSKKQHYYVKVEANKKVGNTTYKTSNPQYVFM